MLAAPSFNVGARIAHETLGVPYANLVLTPILMRSVHSPGRSPLLKIPRWLGSFGARPAYRLIGREYEQMIGARVNAFRSSLGVPAVRSVVHWMPRRILCPWPERVYGRRRHWPAHAETTTSVHCDGEATVGGREDSTAVEIEGEPPIVFTAGTAPSQGTDFFAAAAEACARG